ncbi:MAG: type I-F CRISPR-associated protein Csy2 [Stenotrophomonas sp.]|uniref:type I-F CRISPR-associated protein Csy2 n=1 Tax=Stenotrophomonas sp. TaxID=69392 RepID=UPI003D6D5FB7
MSACPAFSHVLVFPHLRVQNANAISSPLTHGFPSMTAFLGLMWALQRKANAAGLDIQFSAVGVVCHQHQEQATEGGFIGSFHLTRNPVGKDGGSAAIVEEGRIHLQLSLLLAADSPRWALEPAARDADLATLAELLAGMRIAGGSVMPPAQPWRRRYQPWALDLTGTGKDRQALFAKARMRLLPGFSLVGRDDLLAQRQQQREASGDANPLDAWLSLARINWRWATDEPDGKGAWSHDRAGNGWIVPIPVGYGALGELHSAGSVANTRDAHTPFRFVESLYSVGQWISPHRLHCVESLLWYAERPTNAGVYRCRNDHATTLDDAELDVTFDLDTSY